MKRILSLFTYSWIIAHFFFLSLSAHARDPDLLSRAKDHLKKINDLSKQDEDFDVEKTYHLSQEVLKKTEDRELPKELRSRYLNIYAGLVGLYAKAEWDKDEGRNAFYANKRALTVFPCNAQAAMGYAQSLVSVDESFWSHFAKKNLGIAGDEFMSEVQLAIQFLEIQEHKEHKSRIEKLKKELEEI